MVAGNGLNPVNELQVFKRIADPIHGLIRLTEIESEVLQHPAFQRLRDISQLGLAKYVYPGAMHNRFSHSLGVLYNVTQIFDVAYRNWKRNPQLCGDIDPDEIFNEFTLQTTRLAAMCHDLGHFPFSHNLEKSFDWMTQKGITDHSFRHEQLSATIVREILGHILGEYTDTVADLIDNNNNSLGTNLFPSFVISSAIDADRMDYLIRDAHHCGVNQGRYDKERLLDSILPYATKINGKKHNLLGFYAKGIESVEQFLLARHRMHQTVYFNPSVVGFEAGIARAYYRVSSEDPPWELPTTYLDNPSLFLDFNEAQFIVQLKDKLKENNSWLIDPILKRKPLCKMGPFYHTIISDQSSSREERERFSLLKAKQDQLENPSDDWFQQDHWIYVENKKQKLIDPLPSNLTDETGFEEARTLKNVVPLINANGDLVDPTDVSFGHTFLPFITGHTYHRFIFFTHKKNKDRAKSELKEVINTFDDVHTRQINY